MTMAATAPQYIAGSIINDVGPDVHSDGIERILSYVGKDRRFGSWDEAAEAIAFNNGPAFERYTREDWLKMARRNCREENGEIRFDYDMAIAEPFKASGPTPRVDLWPIFAALAQKPLLVIRGAKSDLLTEETAIRMQQVAPEHEACRRARRRSRARAQRGGSGGGDRRVPDAVRRLIRLRQFATIFRLPAEIVLRQAGSISSSTPSRRSIDGE